jgi:uncharacterized protein
MIYRPHYLKSIRSGLKHSPISAILGPRQCGKTTIAGVIAKEIKAEYFDLEDPVDLTRLENPMFTLEGIDGLVIIDEIQRKPDLFPVLRVLVDRNREKTKYLILGSASPHLVKNVSESLAGRVAFIEMDGLDIREIDDENFNELWIRGGFPNSYLAKTDAASFRWRNDFIKTFLERDIPQLGISIPAMTIRRFWTMTAHFHGQIWNAAEFARSMGSSEGTARRYLDILSGAYVVRQLQPWFENIKKRQIKSPKIYIRDSGLLHALLSINSSKRLFQHPKYGASWEGFALEQVLKVTGADDFYFWGTHGGAELDLLLFKNGKRFGFEFKCNDAPSITKSIEIAKQDLNLEKVFIIYPGIKSYPLDHNTFVISLKNINSSEILRQL